MIYPFDSAYAQEVLRVNYDYSDALKGKREKIAARTMGLIRHDRFLHKRDSETDNHEARRRLSSSQHHMDTVTIQ